MRRLPLPIQLALAVVAATPFVSAQDAIDLTKACGGDPAQALRAIAMADGRNAAQTLAAALREPLDGPTLLALLRFGLGHPDDAVVVGAAVLARGPIVAVPELARAATVAVPKVLAKGSPLDVDAVQALVGSVDVPAILARAAALPDRLAAIWLGHAHRVMRSEHVPALDAAARAATGELRAALVDDAAMVAEYSGLHEERVVALQGWALGATAEPRADGLPQPLRALLGWLVRDHADARGKFPDQDVRWTQPVRRAPVARWLRRATPSAADTDLLLGVADLPDAALRAAAYAAMGALACEPTKARLAAAADAGSATAAAALARRGDDARLDALLQASTANELASGLAVASPARRLRFAADLLAADADVATDQLQAVAETAAGCLGSDAPPFDDAWFDGLEALAFAAPDLAPATLRALLAAIPSCATARLCDRLLKMPPASWLASAPPGITLVDELGLEVDVDPCAGDVGWRGALPLLEATRPDALRAVLRAALAGDDVPARDAAARLLLRLQDKPSAAALVAWVRAQPEAPWRALGDLGGAVAMAALKAAAADADDDGLRTLAQALALADGMPRALATEWFPDDAAASVARLLADGAAAAFVADAQGRDEPLPVDDLAALASWRDPAAEAYLPAAVAAASAEWNEEQTVYWRWVAAVARGDDAELAALRTLLRDGRYALQSTFDGRRAAAVLGGEALAFWIDELGSNCCRKSDLADDALAALFGAEPQSAEEDVEPAAARLRRRLLPLQGRLRWSMLANGFVVAGQ